MAAVEPCASCHASLLAGAPFCHNCGASATVAQAEEPPGPPLEPTPERLQVVLDTEGAGPTPPPPAAPPPEGSARAAPPPTVTPTATTPSGMGATAKGFLAAAGVTVAAGVGFLAYQAISDDPEAAASGDPFCDEVEEIAAEAAAQADEFAEIPEGDPLAGLAFLLRAIGDIQVYTDRMLEVAPDEIRSDMEIVAETLQPVTSTDPLEIGLALVEAYSHQNSFTRVDAYTSEHCEISLFGSRPSS